MLNKSKLSWVNPLVWHTILSTLTADQLGSFNHLMWRICSRCTMVNLTGKEVRQGLASYDEMCDVYMMYWADPGDDENQVQFEPIISFNRLSFFYRNLKGPQYAYKFARSIQRCLPIVKRYGSIGQKSILYRRSKHCILSKYSFGFSLRKLYSTRQS